MFSALFVYFSPSNAFDNLFDFDSFHVLVRKLAHFSIYAVLGVFAYNAIFYSIEREYIYLLVKTIDNKEDYNKIPKDFPNSFSFDFY